MGWFGIQARKAREDRERQIDDCTFWLGVVEENSGGPEVVLAFQVMHSLYTRDVIDTAQAVRDGTAINMAWF